MEKSIALFCGKKISKILQKVCKKLLTNRKKCVIIGTQGERNAQKRKNEVKKMKKIFKVLKKIGSEIMFILTGKGDAADEMISLGLISYEGQGRDQFGR